MKVFIGPYPDYEQLELFEDITSKTKTIDVQIDTYDTWNMDVTLAHIIVPMLKQLKESKHGAPFVDMADVPEHLRAEIVDGETDDKHFDRWDWVMGEMIFAFQSKVTDNWDDEFWKGLQCDWDARKVVENRIQNGFELFGKYYQGLWD